MTQVDRDISAFRGHALSASPARPARSVSPTLAAGLALVGFWITVALLAPWISPYHPNLSDFAALQDPTPSAAHWLGVDQLGRDIISRLFWGARTVLMVAPTAVLGAVLLGTVVGLFAGYRGGWTDQVLTRASDVIISFPVLILYLIVLARYGASVWNIIAIVTLTKAPMIARLVRAMTMEIKAREYVLAARMRGESTLFILLIEILPNIRGPLIVEFCLRVGYTVVLLGALGFLGVGLPPPTPDWGSMVKESYTVLSLWPHMALVPCIAISSLVVGFNLIALGLGEKAQRGGA
jgi:ABC-type dipeptide/oligopeptide/nickel transport systems, permease components